MLLVHLVERVWVKSYVEAEKKQRAAVAGGRRRLEGEGGGLLLFQSHTWACSTTARCLFSILKTLFDTQTLFWTFKKKSSTGGLAVTWQQY